jgi:hypothetical protein
MIQGISDLTALEAMSCALMLAEDPGVSKLMVSLDSFWKYVLLILYY